VPDVPGGPAGSSLGGSNVAVRRLENRARVLRLVDEAIQALQVDLAGVRVLTEIASGAYVVTPLIAARAGAEMVSAVTRTSPFGTAADVIDYGQEWADAFGVADRIGFFEGSAAERASEADIVTNLGFVRPIDVDLVARLPRHAVVSLMWEPWEFREQDLDLAACAAAGIPVIATNERHPRLRLFEYVGVLAVKLLLESGVEIVRSRIVIVGSDPFGDAVETKLVALGAKTRRAARAGTGSLDADVGRFVQDADAVVVVEHRDRREMVGDDGGIRAERLVGGCRLIHIAGRVDERALARAGVHKHPDRIVAPGYMTLATDYVGPRPVIELHAAGLRVAADAVRCRRDGGSPADAMAAAERSGLGLGVTAHADLTR
jgi:hypothetical protein